MRTLFDLVLPRECGGCDTPGASWCIRCEESLVRPPVAVRPRVDVGVPCWALGPYAGACRGAVLALKERNRHDLAVPLGHALARAVSHLRLFGELDPPEFAALALVPAPSRARAARIRGGDHVERFARAAASALRPENVSVPHVLRMGRGVRDSVGLGAAERQANVAGRILTAPPVLRRGGTGPAPVDVTVVVVDDVLTTGSTAAETVCVLNDFGVRVDGVLVLAAV
ncbi:ComF family protein [Rhodococcoides kyotonense]|uniref:Predicted amidophosphoribosyltransferases n=1 Tax=Rhodococcoides kyotonense TaxID=398843 RepID=A0A239LWR4_9NOCA|nr:ComF family protein [Rhodococcus kyotonensis]SNT34064.1 Predicted amidophosphoribosyltransferases [Rhodococcus kyotonensis]